MTLERILMLFPVLTSITDTAVSSQDVSMPRIIIMAALSRLEWNTIEQTVLKWKVALQTGYLSISSS